MIGRRAVPVENPPKQRAGRQRAAAVLSGMLRMIPAVDYGFGRSAVLSAMAALFDILIVAGLILVFEASCENASASPAVEAAPDQKVGKTGL